MTSVQYGLKLSEAHFLPLFHWSSAWEIPAKMFSGVSNVNHFCYFLIMYFPNLKNCHDDVILNPQKYCFGFSLDFFIVNAFLILTFFKAAFLVSNLLRTKSQ